MSGGWSLYVIVLTVLNIVGALWLLFWQRKKRVEKGQSLGHEFDGIEELDNPLPRWWLGIFIGTVVWGVAYLLLYPGLGSFPGLLGWTQLGQYQAEVDEADRTYGPIYTAFAAKPFEELARDELALQIGGRLFANNCATCHGSDGRGGSGFPNLTDEDWLYGGDPTTIELSILNGRSGLMPPFAPAIGGEEGVRQVVAYVRSLSGKSADNALIAAGREKYLQVCVGCHGMEGKGLPALGSPNLTDDVWLYGGSEDSIAEGLYKGRNGKMPPHRDILGPERARILAAYVYSLSR